MESANDMTKKGRKPKKHEPIDASFDEVLGFVAKSKYPGKRTITRPKRKAHE